MSEFQGWAFNKNLENGRASGRLTVTRGGVRFDSASGTVELPLNGLQITRGGAGDRLIFFRHPSQPEWSLYSRDWSVLSVPAFQAYDLQDQIGRIKSGRWLAWAAVLAVFAAAAGVVAVLWLSKGALVAAAARQIPPEWEAKLGGTAFAQYSAPRVQVQDKEVNAQFMIIAERLMEGVNDNRHTLRFHIFEDSDINAFAMPGGYVGVNTGLLLNAESAEEVAGVLAHEIAHVTEQHSLRQIIGAAGLYIIVQAAFGDVTGVLAVLSQYGPMLATLKFSRDFESAADAKALLYLSAAEIEPAGLLTFFTRLKDKEAEANGLEDAPAAVQKSVNLLSTHPATAERIDQLREQIGLIENNITTRPMGLQYDRLKDNLRALIASTEEDESSETDTSNQPLP